MLKSVIAISLGASAGSVLRWGLGLMLNALFPPIPMGTLAANLIGGYCVGLAVSFFDFFPALPPEWRLLCITGFLGGLTTFSTFSAESFHLLQRGAIGWLGAHLVVHVAGSVLMTWAGYVLFNALRA